MKEAPKQAPYWTPEQVDQLKKLAGTMTCAQIGEILGRSKDAVKNKIFTLELPRFLTAQRTKADKPALKPKVEKRPPLIAVYRNQNPKKPPVPTEIHSKLQWCSQCGSPVSDWVGHRERLGCERKI